MKLYQATLFSLVLFTSFAQADVENSQWITTWSASPQKVWNKDFVFPTLIPEQVSNQTIRQMSKISLGGCSRSVLISCPKKTLFPLCLGMPFALPNKDKIHPAQEQDQ